MRLPAHYPTSTAPFKGQRIYGSFQKFGVTLGFGVHVGRTACFRRFREPFHKPTCYPNKPIK